MKEVGKEEESMGSGLIGVCVHSLRVVVIVVAS
jgi:hypothetical protein